MTKNWMWALVAGAMAGVVFGACGGEGAGDLTCSADADCLEGEICAGNVCVVTCSAGADCPDSAKTCGTNPFGTTGGDADAGTTGGSVCQCSTDALCNSEGATDLICQTAYKFCTPKCTTDGTGYTCPSGYECQADSGQCTAAAGCESNADCAQGETCNTETGACEAAAACDPNSTTVGANGGHDTCDYGSYCAASGCVEVTQGTCAMASGAPTWNNTNTGSPVIFNVTAQRFSSSNMSTECGDGGPKTEVTVNYYSATALFNTTTFNTWKSQVQVKFGGGFVNPAFEVSSFMPTSGANVGTFKFGVCGPAAASGTGAVYVSLPAGGATSNTACFTY